MTSMSSALPDVGASPTAMPNTSASDVGHWNMALPHLCFARLTNSKRTRPQQRDTGSPANAQMSTLAERTDWAGRAFDALRARGDQVAVLLVLIALWQAV